MNVTSVEGKKQTPYGGYEYVDVTFAGADQDVVVPYTKFRVDSANQVRWIDITPSEGRVYRPLTAPRRESPGTVILRCDVANTTTRLLLFVERTEQNG